MARKRNPSSTLTGKVRPHDPFELIRWLAMSQPDPRKALAELVQNSLDAGASRVTVTRARTRGVPTLRIHDDGEGVIPDMARAEALEYVATHIGHSRKRSLTPEERLQLMTQGRYGIGLLGFWSIGEQLEMRSAVPGERPMRLVLARDSADYRVEPLRGRLPLGDRWTEVLVTGIHRDALPVLVGRRVADYLSAELRGQLLARSLDLVVEDRMARGRAQKVISVRPPRFLGERLDGLGPIEVPGHPPIALELYIAGDAAEEDAGELAVYCAGTLVAESFAELGNLGLDHRPWTDPRLTGLVDFPGFQVSPGTRRGIVVDEAAGAFARALDALAPAVEAVLERDERLRELEADRTLVRDLQRAFRDFYRHQPHYALLPVREEERGAASAGDGDEGGPGAADAGSESDEALDEPGNGIETADLLPVGPLFAVGISPTPVRVECRGSRRIRARAFDERARPVTESVRFEWSLEGRVGTLEVDEARPRTALLHAGELPGSGTVRVRAIQGSREASASGSVIVLEEIPSRRSDEGIPDPEFVHAPGAAWRSRMLAGRWQVNSGHREYRAIADRPSLKLRYLAMLFAKEVVVRSHSDPRLDAPLEQLVEVASYADRNVATGRRARRPPRRGSKRDRGV